jgi:hypothetical protein
MNTTRCSEILAIFLAALVGSLPGCCFSLQCVSAHAGAECSEESVTVYSDSGFGLEVRRWIAACPDGRRWIWMWTAETAGTPGPPNTVHTVSRCVPMGVESLMTRAARVSTGAPWRRPPRAYDRSREARRE